MSDERKKVLEMLSEGKISVDEAERLLKALGEGNRGPAAPELDDDHTIDADRVEEQIRAGVEAARRTVRASMPRLRSMIRDAAPDVERVVAEATASIPGIVEEMTKTIRDAFSHARDEGGDDRYQAEAQRDFTEGVAVDPQSLLRLHNRRGHVEVIVWDEERVEAQVHVTVRAHDEDTARACAEAVQLLQEPGDGQLGLRPSYPGGREDVSYRLDVRLSVPRRLRLDLRTAHGDLIVPEMESDLVLGGDHGEIRLTGTAGAAAIDHHHGAVQVGRIGGKLSLNAHHSKVDLDEVVRGASVNAHHGELRLRRVGGDFVVNSHHAPLEVDEVHGDAVANSHHGPLSLRQVLGNLTLNSNHSPVEVSDIGGNLHLSNDHGPVDIETVSGELSVKNNHSPLCNTNGPLDIGPVGGELSVETDRGPVNIGGVGGRLTVRASRSEVMVAKAGGEVLIENSRASITVIPDAPVRSAYALSNNRGDVRVVLPEGSDVEVQGFVRRGRVDTDLPLQVSANGQQGQLVSGTLGAGGAALQVEVDSGTLALQREG